MSSEQKPGDPADRAADGAFGGVQSHRAGYGDDRLARVIDWLRAHPTATLASGEGGMLVQHILLLRARIEGMTEAGKVYEKLYADARAEIDRLTVELGKGALRLEIEMLTVERDRAEAERDEEIARVVRITERLGAETLRADRAERILAALREPSANVMRAAVRGYSGDLLDAIRDAVAAAEQEVGRDL